MTIFMRMQKKKKVHYKVAHGILFLFLFLNILGLQKFKLFKKRFTKIL